MAEVSKTLKDAAYIAVGVGVLGFQRAQVRRQELSRQLSESRTMIDAAAAEAQKQLAEAQKQFGTVSRQLVSNQQLGDAQKQFGGLLREVDQRLAPVRTEFEGRLDDIEDRLPASARELIKTARGVVHNYEHQIRSLVGTAGA